MTKVRAVKAGDRSVYPFNHAFTDQERKVFQILAQLKSAMGTLKAELAKTPYNAHSPAKNYDPSALEEIQTIDDNLDHLDLSLRWIPGGVHRYE